MADSNADVCLADAWISEVSDACCSGVFQKSKCKVFHLERHQVICLECRHGVSCVVLRCDTAPPQKSVGVSCFSAIGATVPAHQSVIVLDENDASAAAAGAGELRFGLLTMAATLRSAAPHQIQH